MHFGDRVCGLVDRKQSRVVAGLDPRVDSLPPFLRPRNPQDPTQVCKAFLELNKLVIDAVEDLAVAVKPQLAFYEAYGQHGIACLEATNRYAHHAGLVVICDAKRNDIGPTAEAYARAFLERSPADGWGVFCDALTVNPYFGSDGILPFVNLAAAQDKGLFVLVKTSNPSSSDLQDVDTEDGPLYLKIARFVHSLAAGTRGQSGYSFVGAVVGGTYRDASSQLRDALPNSIFLVPGFGAQGGTAEDIAACFDECGHGALVSSSRGITGRSHQCLSAGEAHGEIRRQALQMRDQLNEVVSVNRG